MKTFHAQLITAITLVLSGCIDNRLRELGDTLAEPNAPTEGGGVYTDPSCVPATFIDADSVVSAISADLASAPSADRPYLRYVSLADRIDFGACADELATGQRAFSKLINGLSHQPVIVPPRAVDEAGSLLRIDLRDYGWTHPVEVGGVSHADGWEAVVATNPFAIELGGEQASLLASETHTRVPWLSNGAFVSAAASTDLYYALLDMPATLGEIRQSVGLPAALDPVAEGAARGATNRSRVLRPSGNVRTIDRYSVASGTAGYYYEALQIDAAEYLADPLHVQPDAQRLIIFTLPNDLLAFVITSPEGQLRTVAELVLDSNRDDFTASLSTSCQNCHARGIIPFFDEVGAAILSNPDLFPSDVVAAVANGPDDEESARQAEGDSDRFAAALNRAGVPETGGDPISSSYLSFIRDVDLATAASDLLVTPEALRAALPGLTPELRPLGVGLELSRQRFGELYAGAYCSLHAGDENPPAAAACE
jgi:hypothetical protein